MSEKPSSPGSNRARGNRSVLRDTLAGKRFPTWLRFVWLRIPDAAATCILVTIWCMYMSAYALPSNPYSLVVIVIATLGLIALYVSARYARAISRGMPLLWKAYWVLVIVAISVELSVRRELAAGVLERQGFSVGYAVVILCLAGAGLVAVVSMLRTKTSVLRLAGFLLAQALLVFTFAQPYIYANYVGAGWDLEATEIEAAEAISRGRDATIGKLLEATPEQLHGAVTYLRENPAEIPEWFYDRPPLTTLLSGNCERTNFGAALYLSTITWTSVGFGDLVPTMEARGFAAIESILGYLFMAALAAVLIRWVHNPVECKKKERASERASGSTIEFYR